jgi:general secretion pathway protein K
MNKIKISKIGIATMLHLNILKKGFILVITLWLLLILTVAASFFATWTQHSMELVQQLHADLQGEIDVYNTNSQLFYLLATHRFSMGGLRSELSQLTINIDEYAEFDPSIYFPVGGEIRLDDTVYHGLGAAKFAIQDKAGLFSLHLLSFDVTGGYKIKAMKLLGLLGVPAELREIFVDRFQDYTDVDDFHRLHGAESIHYEQANLPPPPNRLLINPMEARGILGWNEQESLWQDGSWAQVTTTARAGLPNLNTMPELVLQSLEGIDAQIARSIINWREEFGVFTNYHQFQRAAGVAVGSEAFTLGYRLFPSDQLRISVWHEGSQRMRQTYIQLTPVADKAKPWLVHYYMDLAVAGKYQRAQPKTTAAFVTGK